MSRAVCVVQVDNPLFGAGQRTGGLRRSAILSSATTMARQGGGTLVLVTDQTPMAAPSADPDHAARQAGDLQWWQQISARFAPHSVRMNTIRVGYAPFLGHALSQPAEAELLSHQIVRRPVVEADLQAALTLLFGSVPSTMVGEILPLDGGLGTTLVSTSKPGSVRPDHSTEPPAAPWNLEGRTVLVAGASSGIGAATAIELARRRADLVLLARRKRELDEVAAAITEHFDSIVRTVDADLADPATPELALARAFSSAGRVDDLVYTAGMLIRDDPREDTVAQRERAYRVNTLAYADMAERLARRWATDGHRGSIVGVSSSSAEIALVPGLYSYSSSKAAMEHLSLQLAISLARHRIRVNAVVPGFVDTPMAATADPAFVSVSMRRVPVAHPSEPEDLAAVIAYLASPASAMISGARLRVCGGLATLGPLPALTESGPHAVRATATAVAR
ncbi:SDR family NAD(P)-dependent oxidoreductase [Amycolatopsis thermoflava]|uniref:SDR family NAD(P)-dependent oxidoreductase n=1 Tax=Amycolatopsis thermoflava TaxID=84480 RepID=UPI0038117257